MRKFKKQLADSGNYSVLQLTAVGAMAAVVFVVTLFRIPLGQSKVSPANAFCLLAGLLLGPVPGGLASGIGSALYDALLGGYDPIQVIITLVSKFMMAWVCGTVFGKGREQTLRKATPRLVISCVLGSLTYVALYMLKTWVYQKFVYGYPMDAVWITMGAKLIPSLINAAFACVVAPILYPALNAIPRGLRGLKKE